MNLKSYNDQLTLEKSKLSREYKSYIAQPLFYQTSAPMGVQSALFDILRLSSKIPSYFVHRSMVLESSAVKHIKLLQQI